MISRCLRFSADRDPDGIAVSSRGSTVWQGMTFAELRKAALTAAGHAAAWKRQPGPVVVLVDNTAVCVAVLLGLFMAGVDTLLVERENSYLADDRSIVHRLQVAGLAGPSDTCLSVPGLVLRTFDELTCGRIPKGTAAPLEDTATAVLQLTSGSTGESRVARQTLSNVLVGGDLYRSIYQITPDDTIFATVPLAHSFGLVGALAAALVSGARLRTLPRFRPGAVLEALDEGATVLLGTPLVYELTTPVLPRAGLPGKVRVALSSGGPLAPRSAEAAAARLGVPVHQVYGSTETGMIACRYDRDLAWPEGCVGAMAPGVEWRVRTDGPQTAKHGRGQLLVHTSTMFEGYADSDEPLPVEGGLLACGDLTEVDEHGHVFVLARKDAFINVGGRKVSPRRIERVVEEHPGVHEVHVFGATGRAGEEAVHAALVLDPRVNVAQVLQFCRSRLMAYEVPHRVHVLAALPRTGMGKVDRRRLLKAVALEEENAGG